MDKPDDMYAAFVSAQKEEVPRWWRVPLKLIAAAVAIAVIELPAYSAYLESSTCVARTGDLSCVSVIEAGVFWQGIALPLIGLTLWLLLRRRR